MKLTTFRWLLLAVFMALVVAPATPITDKTGTNSQSQGRNLSGKGSTTSSNSRNGTTTSTGSNSQNVNSRKGIPVGNGRKPIVTVSGMRNNTRGRSGNGRRNTRNRKNTTRSALPRRLARISELMCAKGEKFVKSKQPQKVKGFNGLISVYYCCKGNVCNKNRPFFDVPKSRSTNVGNSMQTPQTRRGSTTSTPGKGIRGSAPTSQSSHTSGTRARATTKVNSQKSAETSS
jgi:hypothetical protein